MAYDTGKYDVMLGRAQVVTSTGDKLFWSPAYVPVIIRAVSFTNVVAPTVTPTVVDFDRRPTAGSDSGRVLIATITIPLSLALGKVIYKDGLNHRVDPGNEVVVEVTTASTAGSGTFGIDVERAQETPANNTAMQASV